MLAISPGYYSGPKRNLRQRLCKIFGLNQVHYGLYENGELGKQSLHAKEVDRTFNHPAIVFLHDIMSTILVFQNNEMAAMLFLQTSPEGPYVKFEYTVGQVSENALFL